MTPRPFFASGLAAALIVVSGCFVVTNFDVEADLGLGGASPSAGGSSSEGDGGLGGEDAAGGDGAGGGAGSGQPPACMVAADCSSHATDGACQTTMCDAGACAVALSAAGTEAGPQTLGDCTVMVCDGAGAIVALADGKDTFDDNNECTDDTCVGMVITPVPLPAGTMCGNNGSLACDSKGVCTGCNADTACPPDTVCIDHFCDMPTNTCASTPVTDGTVCTTDGLFCTGVEVCSAGNCISPGDPCPQANNCMDECDEGADNCSGFSPQTEVCYVGAQMGCCLLGICKTNDPIPCQ